MASESGDFLEGDPGRKPRTPLVAAREAVRGAGRYVLGLVLGLGRAAIDRLMGKPVAEPEGEGRRPVAERGETRFGIAG